MRPEPIVYLTAILLLIFPAAGSTAQDIPGAFKAFAEKVESQTGFVVAYSPADIPSGISADHNIAGLDAKQALYKVLDPDNYRLVTLGRHIIVLKVAPPPPEPDRDEEALERARAMARFAHGKLPPRESVFSGETRLIIIREREDDGRENRREPADRPESTVNQRMRRIVISNGITAIQLEADERGLSGEIPFRWDLYEKQAYRTIPPKKIKSRRKRS